MKTIIGKTIKIDDEFIGRSNFNFDNKISIRVEWSTYGEVARWMASYRGEDMDKITKENYKSYFDGSFYKWDSNMIKNGGMWLSTFYGTGEKFDAIDHNMKLSADTPFIKIIENGIDNKWDEKVYVLSFYTGRQGLLTISVFDDNTGVLMFSFTSLCSFAKINA